MKVIGIGFHKTGTSTLGKALSHLGYNVIGARTDLAKYLFKNNYEKVFEVADQFDALQDNPWAVIYKELDKQYPGSKFILTTRDEKKWLRSIINHFQNDYTEMRRWIYGVGRPKGNDQIYLERYRKHNNEILKYFEDRPDDLLILSWEEGDGWEKICDFLNKPVPNEPFPFSNKGNYSIKKGQSLLRSKIRQWLKRG